MSFLRKMPKFDKSENFFYKNRSRFLGLYISIVIVLTILVLYLTTQYINIEERHASEINCEYVQNICDTTLGNIEYRLYQISSDQDVSLFFGNISLDSFYLTKNNVIKALKTITTGEKYLSTAYLYNPFTNMLIFQDSVFFLDDETDNFSDTGWYEEFKKMGNNEVKCYRRKKTFSNTSYLTIIRKTDRKTIKGGIILNIDIDYFMQLANGNYKCAVVAEDNSLLYTSDDIAKKLLSKNSFETNKSYIKKMDGKYYSIMSMKSKFTDMDYYTITPLNDYKGKIIIIFLSVFLIACLFVFFGFKFASYFAFQSYKPIINIAMLLKNPNDIASRNYLKNDVNTKFIAERIMYVVNSNKNLKSQLNTKNQLFDSAQITALQTQINPHFIYNTLTLFYLTSQDALGKDHSLSKGLISLSKLMRYCLSSDNAIVNLEEEVESANEYLKIMKNRYSDRFEVFWDIDENCYGKRIVKMSLQPVLENIFKYAFKKDKKDGIISIKIKEVEQNILISIKDNGLGIKPEKLEEIRTKLKKGMYSMSRHIGLGNVDKRIKIIFGDKYGLFINSEYEKGTEVILKFPKEMV